MLQVAQLGVGRKVSGTFIRLFICALRIVLRPRVVVVGAVVLGGEEGVLWGGLARPEVSAHTTQEEQMAVQRFSVAQIATQMSQLAESPQDLGVLEYIVLRLPDEQRASPQEAEVSPDGGLEGDRWARPKSPNPGAQISVMNSRFLRIIAVDDVRMSLAGDNLLVDLDLSEENLPAGTRLQIGTATFEVTDVPHTGCKKFQRRYGKDALEVVNAETHRSKRLRGLFIRTIQAGEIQVGDSIRKITATDDP